MKAPLTVIFLTLNEEFHIGDAIDNVADIAEEIFVVDSLSSDNTVSIALAKGARVVQRPFTNFGDQWNFALDNLPVSTDWTMKMDPDERLSDELKQEILTALPNNPASAFEFKRTLFFMGKPLVHCTSLVVRIWRTGRCHFSGVMVNEHPIVEDAIVRLKGKMRHYDSRDLHHWVEKQNRYTSMEALMRFRQEQLAYKPNLFGTKNERRMFLKKIFFHVPGRYLLLRLYLLFGCGAWRAGRIGQNWVSARIIIMKLREMKYYEMQQNNREIYIPRPSQGTFADSILNTDLQKNLMGRHDFKK